MGFRASASDGVIKTFLFCGKSSAECYYLIMMDMDQMLQIGLKLHMYFRLKAVKQKRLKASLYPLPSLESFHMVACLELVERFCWSIRSGPQDASLAVCLP